MESVTTQQLIEELENQMPCLVTSIAERDFAVAADLMTRRDEILHQLTEVKDMPAEQKEYIRNLCMEIKCQHEQWLGELTKQHTNLADELKIFAARNKATQLYKNNR